MFNPGRCTSFPGRTVFFLTGKRFPQSKVILAGLLYPGRITKSSTFSYPGRITIPGRFKTSRGEVRPWDLWGGGGCRGRGEVITVTIIFGPCANTVAPAEPLFWNHRTNPDNFAKSLSVLLHAPPRPSTAALSIFRLGRSCAQVRAWTGTSYLPLHSSRHFQQVL